MKNFVLLDQNLDTVEIGGMLDLVNYARLHIDSITSFKIEGLSIKSVHNGAGRITEINIPENAEESIIEELAKVKIADFDAIQGLFELDSVLWRFTIIDKKITNATCKFTSRFYGENLEPWGREGTVFEKIANRVCATLRSFISSLDPKVYLGNAFSLQMLNVEKGLKGSNINIRSVDIDSIVEEITISYDRKIISVVGHKDTANIISNIVGLPVEFNRESIKLGKFDLFIVAQVTGGRLPEGCTELPEGIEINFFMVSTNVRGLFI